MNGEKLTIFSIASAADVTEVAIRNFDKILAIHATAMKEPKLAPITGNVIRKRAVRSG
jgi:hypothetical protein